MSIPICLLCPNDKSEDPRAPYADHLYLDFALVQSPIHRFHDFKNLDFSDRIHLIYSLTARALAALSTKSYDLIGSLSEE